MVDVHGAANFIYILVLAQDVGMCVLDGHQHFVYFNHCWPSIWNRLNTVTGNLQKIKDFTIESLTEQRFVNRTIQCSRDSTQ
jgi:hypothetical protein